MLNSKDKTKSFIDFKRALKQKVKPLASKRAFRLQWVDMLHQKGVPYYDI